MQGAVHWLCCARVGGVPGMCVTHIVSPGLSGGDRYSRRQAMAGQRIALPCTSPTTGAGASVADTMPCDPGTPFTAITAMHHSTALRLFSQGRCQRRRVAASKRTCTRARRGNLRILRIVQNSLQCQKGVTGRYTVTCSTCPILLPDELLMPQLRGSCPLRASSRTWPTI